jgi:plastocyanin
MTQRSMVFLILLATMALALAGCGGGGGSATTGGGGGGATTGGGGGGGQTLALAADPSGALKYDKTQLEATAGDITIDLTNDSPLPHDVAVEGNGVQETSDRVTGGSTTLNLNLKAGTYTFFCSVDGHRAAGMEGTLVVK